MLPPIFNCDICVVGLGYVGLPLAVEIAKTKSCKKTSEGIKRRVTGFDISEKRLKELKIGFDITGELTKDEILKCNLKFSSNINEIINSDLFIITVPTPIDSANQPDLTALKSATIMVGEALKKRNKKTTPLIVYESTVFPGATEEICIPIIEEKSSFKCNKDFFCGFSPERINPGDKKNKLDSIIKVTSGSDQFSAEWIDIFYQSIINAGTFKAKSIKVAEAAKIIENTQRDLNIALINELTIIFNKLNIDTLSVLEAAKTKWNFFDFKPGLVGGHCIGVDPYYLTYKSQVEGYTPQIVLAGRRINDGMAKWVVEKLIINMIRKGMLIKDSEILILGLSFKENCTDLRNTKVIDIIKILKDYKANIEVVDPYVSKEEANRLFNIQLQNKIPKNKKYSAVILAVAHDKFKAINPNNWKELIHKNGIIFDLKGIIPEDLNLLRI